MTEIILVRHAETSWDTERRYAGSSDVPLNRRGQEQARRLAAWARRANVTACWSSTQSRARDTLTMAAFAAHTRPVYDPRLREVDFGAAEGLPESEAHARYEAYLHDPAVHPLADAEQPNTALARARACLDSITGADPDGRVLLVWHPTIMRLVLCELLGIPIARYRRALPLIRPATLTELRLTDDRCALLRFNAPLA